MSRLLFLLLVASAPVVAAFDWPVERIIITATFGEQRGDHFHNGVDVGGGEQPVRPLSPGELVFSYTRSRDYTSLPVGLGTFCVLQHEGEIRSLYSHLKADSLDPRRLDFGPRDFLGITGDTGHSYGRHLHLTIIDMEMNTIINPLLVLPPVEDGQPPTIQGLYLKNGPVLEEVKDGQTISPQNVELVIEVFDLREDVSFIWRHAPYQIFLYQDGQETASIRFDSLEQRKTPDPEAPSQDPVGAVPENRGRRPPANASSGEAGLDLVLTNTDLSYQDLYLADWLFRLGSVKLVPGTTSLMIVAMDFAGNESSREYQLKVRN